MKELITALCNGHQLNEIEAKELLIAITNGTINESQTVAFMSIYMMRPISIDELSGFKNAMLELAIKVDTGNTRTIDVCGTGGDGKNTFNISTCTSFVLAAMGVKVTKHGNYGVSSVSGSSNVLEYFGMRFKKNTMDLIADLEENNICFIHAPYFHPALKQVSLIRKALGVRTFFNMLGPLVNPALPHYRCNGVFNLELLRKYHYIYQQEKNSYAIMHDLNGYDEISLTGQAKLYTHKEEKLISAYDFGIKDLKSEQLFGGNTIEAAAKIFYAVLNNESTEAQKQVVAVNAALAYKTVHTHVDDKTAFALAIESIENKKAFTHFKNSLLTKKILN
jgi:anthranilate phosphoribosyltransferase